MFWGIFAEKQRKGQRKQGLRNKADRDLNSGSVSY